MEVLVSIFAAVFIILLFTLVYIDSILADKLYDIFKER